MPLEVFQLKGNGFVERLENNPYNSMVRSLLATLVLVVFASLNAIDGICCPDGCTHEETASSSPAGTSTTGVCVLCAGGLHRPALEDAAPAIPKRSHVTAAAATAPHDAPPEPPEHPPRS